MTVSQHTTNRQILRASTLAELIAESAIHCPMLAYVDDQDLPYVCLPAGTLTPSSPLIVASTGNVNYQWARLSSAIAALVINGLSTEGIIPKFIAPNGLGNSNISDDGDYTTIANYLKLPSGAALGTVLACTSASTGLGVWEASPNVTSISTGSNPATAGSLRLSRSESIRSMNHAEDGNVTLLQLQTGDIVALGGAAYQTKVGGTMMPANPSAGDVGQLVGVSAASTYDHRTPADWGLAQLNEPQLYSVTDVNGYRHSELLTRGIVQLTNNATIQIVQVTETLAGMLGSIYSPDYPDLVASVELELVTQWLRPNTPNIGTRPGRTVYRATLLSQFYTTPWVVKESMDEWEVERFPVFATSPDEVLPWEIMTIALTGTNYGTWTISVTTHDWTGNGYTFTTWPSVAYKLRILGEGRFTT